jgi:hypothetical protein
MELLAVIALAGWVGYGLFRGNTLRGIETVRAYVYMGNLVAGASAREANLASLYDVASGPTDMIREAIACLQEDYAGKQSAMISDAYGKGMKPKLPFWYRTILIRAATSPATAS